MAVIATMDELRAAGLLDDSPVPQLTSKGRDWLRMLERAETDRIVDAAESDEDFVMSTSGLLR